MPTQKKLHLRPATFDDANLLFAWRNDRETRERSKDTHEVAWKEHLAWLKKSLNELSSSRKLYIAEDDGRPVGTVRGDRSGQGVELSWTIAPEARGKGYSKTMVLQFAREIFPNEKLTACIEEGNIASEKIAKALALSKAEKSLSKTTNRIFFYWR